VNVVHRSGGVDRLGGTVVDNTLEIVGSLLPVFAVSRRDWMAGTRILSNGTHEHIIIWRMNLGLTWND